MLHLYRRHLKLCPHKSMRYRRCKCPVWVFGSIDGKRVRRALDTSNWDTAEEKLRAENVAEEGYRLSVAEAVELFEKDCEARGLASQTLGKYELLGKELKERFKVDLRAITIDDLRKYRESWKMGPLSSKKKLERLKTFFRFAHESGWIRTNVAKVLKGPMVADSPTLPFTDAEMEKILWATDLFPTDGWYGVKKPARVKAFVLLLRYSGMRIGDCATLEREKIKDGKLFLYTAKTKTPVYVPLPREVVKALEAIDDGSKYFFWSGNGTVKSATSAWQRSLSKLFTLAGVKGHAHRFRDTFSTNLLQSGVSLETVSILLGHSSVKITEKHYAPFVKARQIALEKEIEKAWKL